MLDSQARIVESPRRIGMSLGNAEDAERAVNFKFQVQWSTLFVALESAKLTVPAVALSELAVPEPAPILTPRASEGRAESGSTVQWEMVIPKMARPSSRISAAPIIATSESAPPPLPRPEPLPPPHTGASNSVLEIGTERHWVFRMRPGTFSLAGKMLLGGALAAGVSIPIVLRSYLPRSPASVETATRSGSWMRESSTPAGANQPRQLVLYRPSLGATDCRLEFTWKVSDRALAWTFRAKDPDNYYAMAIKALRPGPSPALSVEHFTVYQGIESPHSSKVLLLGDNNAALQVRMDVSGATFKLYLEGNAADYWTDNRLGAGGLGFLEQPDQPADVDRVRMSFSQVGGA
jgi:hypothetical protein